MKILLVAVNAKYIHSNLGIYSLKSYADGKLGLSGEGAGAGIGTGIGLAEYTINHQLDYILQDIYRRKPDVIGFSCYIWNIDYVKALGADLKKVLPGVSIWLGGPEVSYDAGKVLEENLWADGVMKGEGEETFAQLAGLYVDKEPEDDECCGKISGAGSSDECCASTDAGQGSNDCCASTVEGQGSDDCCASTDAGQGSNNCCASTNAGQGSRKFRNSLECIPGLTFRRADGTLADTGFRDVMDLSMIPFPYRHIRLEDLEHRIIYYESSRGCPFSCSYCLSSIDKTVRLRSLSLVKDELAYFLDARVPQVKFVDRTFNCNRKHAMEIWQFIQDHDNGVTNFHFEIAADLLDQSEIELLGRMRPGLVQLEIGVQSTNPATLRSIRRKTNIEEIRRITRAINGGRNVHQHLDLIAGLPEEDIQSFCNSFNQVYSMEPEQLQLGFLKVLKGSYMEEMARSYGLTYSDRPPYEVLSTRWLSYGDILELKGVEEMVEVYYNSRQFTSTLAALEKEYPGPYEMFLDMSRYYRDNGLTGMSHGRTARYEILYRIICRLSAPVSTDRYRDLLMYDLYLRENVKSRPSFARDQSMYKTAVREFFRKEETAPRYLEDYKGYDYRQMSKMAHVEAMGDGSLVLFDYKRRDPLTYNAWAGIIGHAGFQTRSKADNNIQTPHREEHIHAGEENQEKT